MASTNATIAAIFEQIADLLELQDANAFRVRAYRNASQSIADFGTDLRDYLARGNPLQDIPGIGADLAKKIEEILDSGTCAFLLGLERQVPPGITRLLRVPGLGPKRVRTLWHDLQITTLEQLREAARTQRIRTLPGFGEKTEHKILEAAERYIAQSAPRFRLADAERSIEPLTADLSKVQGVTAVEVAGSYRRRRETVGDLDLVVASDAPENVMEAFIGSPQVREVLSKGTTRTSVVLACGLQVDLRAVPLSSFGAACQYFTGSKAHNIAVRRIAQDLGLKINEYGVYRDEVRIAGRTEKEVYRSIGLAWIPPELREDRGEIQAARDGKLPALIEPGDVRGDLHVEVADGGQQAMDELVCAAGAAGLHYLAITLPSARLHADSGAVERLIHGIERINGGGGAIVCLSAIAVRILRNGDLDAPDNLLKRFDVVIAAIEDDFDLPRARQTERVLAVLRHPMVAMLAHPTGRVLGERAGIELDMQPVMRAAAAGGVVLEVDGRPGRLDLPDLLCRIAAEEKVLLALSAGARAPQELRNLRYALGQARRGWVTRQDVLNTRTLDQVRKALRRG